MKQGDFDQHTRVMVALFALSLVLRLLALWIVPTPHLSTNATTAYLGGSRLILEGEGFKDPLYPVFTPPLYAVSIAIGSFLFGTEQIPIKLFQIVLDSFTTVIVYAIIRELIGSRVAVLSGIGWGVYPFSIYATLYIGSEAMFTFLLSLFVLLALRIIQNPQSWRLYSPAGVVLGLATLTRGTTQFLPVFILVGLLLAFRHIPKGVMQGYLIFLLSYGLILCPWAVRNYLVLHEFVPVATGGSVLLQGASDEFLTIENKTKYEGYFEQLKARGIHMPANEDGPVAMDRFFVRAGLESYKMRLEQDPLSIVPFMAMKFGRLWYSTESGNNERIILYINGLIYVPAVVGLWVASVRHRRYVWILGPVILYFILLHWLTLPLFRYILPVMPFIIALAGLGMTVAFEAFWRKRNAAAS